MLKKPSKGDEDEWVLSHQRKQHPFLFKPSTVRDLRLHDISDEAGVLVLIIASAEPKG